VHVVQVRPIVRRMLEYVGAFIAKPRKQVPRARRVRRSRHQHRSHRVPSSITRRVSFFRQPMVMAQKSRGVPTLHLTTVNFRSNALPHRHNLERCGTVDHQFEFCWLHYR